MSFQVLFRDGAKQRSRTFDNPKSAQTFADLVHALGPKRALAELEGGPAVGITLDDLAEKFFEWKESRVRSDRTVADYRRDYANWIAKPLGWRAAASIDEMDVQDWVDSMQGRITAKSIHDRHAILHGIYRFGSSPTRAIIPVGHNPTIGTELPKKVKTPMLPIRPAEWAALHAALQQIDPDAADLADFLGATGWRFSEAIALTTHDVVDEGRYMRVTVSQVARRAADGSVRIVRDAKSRAGQRTNRIDPDIAAVIRRRVEGLPPGSLVFTTSGGSMWNYGNFRARFWAKALKAANISRPIKIHALRHLNVAQLDHVGVSPAQIKNRVGHESITTTINTYGGMIGDLSDAHLDALAELRRGGRPVELPEVSFEIND